MKPEQACIATAVYAPECGCRMQIEVRRGDIAPVCPRCGARVAWQFVQSVHVSPCSEQGAPAASMQALGMTRTH